jgi:hypothetical protein
VLSIDRTGRQIKVALALTALLSAVSAALLLIKPDGFAAFLGVTQGPELTAAGRILALLLLGFAGQLLLLRAFLTSGGLRQSAAVMALLGLLLIAVLIIDSAAWAGPRLIFSGIILVFTLMYLWILARGRRRRH